MTNSFPPLSTRQSGAFRTLWLGTGLVALGACTPGAGGGIGPLDWDLRGGGALTTRDAALQATQSRPQADARGVISYPGYQVAVARRGDTVASVASRIGADAAELARYNAIVPTDPLRDGEIIALPRRVAESGGMMAGAGVGVAPVDVSSIATTALDRAGGSTASAGAEPLRHQVRRGETAFGIARAYNVSARALGEWNGLGANLDVREGQYLIIPVANAAASASASGVSQPGQGSATPTPPSAAKPLPAEQTTPAASKPKETPASPGLAAGRTSTAKMMMPVSGSIIRPYAKGRNEGIDIAASAGAPVKAAAGGTVAAITKDTEQTPIIVIRHDGNLLTVYAGVDAITVKKGDSVQRGQTIASVRAGTPTFLHFEVRRGVESTDPVPFLQ
jgi:murein DD-endopeptidase MepM/ murein hydrolase activator NlpD